MGAVNPSLITNLIFQKRPVQNVLQQLAFAINGRAGVNQAIPVFVSLLSAGGQTDDPSASSKYVNTVTGSSPVTDVTTRDVIAGSTAPAGEVSSFDMGFFLPASAALGTTITLRWALQQATSTTPMPRTVSVQTFPSNSAGPIPVYLDATPVAPAGNGFAAYEFTTFVVGTGSGEIPANTAVRVTIQLDAVLNAQDIRLVACDVSYTVNTVLSS